MRGTWPAMPHDCLHPCAGMLLPEPPVEPVSHVLVITAEDRLRPRTEPVKVTPTPENRIQLPKQRLKRPRGRAAGRQLLYPVAEVLYLLLGDSILGLYP